MTVFQASKDTPQVTQALIDHLEKRYPLSLFKSVKSIEQLNLYQGHQEVLDYLRHLLKQ